MFLSALQAAAILPRYLAKCQITPIWKRFDPKLTLGEAA
jgi:hypothetical protein